MYNNGKIAETFMIDNEQISDHQPISNVFNCYLSRVGENLAQNIPNATTNYNDYLSGSYEKSAYSMKTWNLLKSFQFTKRVIKQNRELRPMSLLPTTCISKMCIHIKWKVPKFHSNLC